MNDQSLSRIAVAALVMAAAPAPAFGQSAGQSGPKPIGRAQFIASMDGEFAKMDADKDGKLTSVEIQKFQDAKALADAQARNKEWFVRLDTNKNGSLSATEFAKMVATPAASSAQPLLARMDASRDGQVSQAEYRAATVVNFDRLDTDRNGTVTPAEMKAGGISPP